MPHSFCSAPSVSLVSPLINAAEEMSALADGKKLGKTKNQIVQQGLMWLDIRYHLISRNRVVFIILPVGVV